MDRDLGDSEREEKQNYLQEKILEANYDTQHFLNYLTDLRGIEGTDIDNWSLDDLKDVVQKYINMVNSGSGEIVSSTPTPDTDTVQPNASATTNSNQTETEDLPDKDEIVTRGAQVKEDSQVTIRKNSSSKPEEVKQATKKSEVYEEVIKCVTTEVNLLYDQRNIKITVSNPEKHAGGFFSSAYITYLVTTEPINFKVKRRYSDFEWLRKILYNQYPGKMIPPIPSKNYGDRFNDQFISKRMRYLEKFMDALSKNEDIKNSQIFLDFIQVADENLFEKKKNEHNKVKVPSNVNELKTTKGIVVSKITKEYESYADNLKNYVVFNETILKKLSSSYKLLNTEMEAVSNRLKEISEYYNQLFFISEKANESITIKETYKMLNVLMNKWSMSYNEQAKLMYLDMKEYFNYIRKEFASYQDLITKMENNKYAFYKADQRLVQKKLEFFNTANVAKWELSNDDLKIKAELLKDKEMAFSKMLPKETAHVGTLKQEYGYYLNQIYTEFERMVELNGKRYRSHFVEFSEKHTDILTDLHVIWADLLSYYTESYDSTQHKNK